MGRMRDQLVEFIEQGYVLALLFILGKLLFHHYWKLNERHVIMRISRI